MFYRFLEEWFCILLKKSWNIPKGYSESVNKKIAGKKKHDKNTPKTMIHKYLQRTLRIENHVCFVDRCLSFCPFAFAFGHCVVCPSIYGFWLHLWYLKTLLTPDRIYIELPVRISHLDRPFCVPSVMCPRFLVTKLTYPIYAYKPLAMRNLRACFKVHF